MATHGRPTRRWGTVASALAVTLTVGACVSACESPYGTDKGYGYSCPPPVGYRGVVYRHVAASPGLAAGEALGTVTDPGCVGAAGHDPRTVTLYAVGDLPPEKVVGVKDADSWLIYADEDLGPGELCSVSSALCP